MDWVASCPRAFLFVHRMKLHLTRKAAMNTGIEPKFLPCLIHSSQGSLDRGTIAEVLHGKSREGH